VDVLPADEVAQIKGYQAVIVGASIREQAGFRRLSASAQIHRDALLKRPLVYFAVSGLMSNPTFEHFEVYEYLSEIRAIAEPLGVGIFAGALDYDRQTTSR